MMLQKILKVLLNFLFIKHCIVVSTKILSCTIFFNFDNNKKRFIEHQISMLEWFHKDHVTLKNQPFAITGINYITHYYCLYCILIKYYLKCIRCENNRFLLKTYKKLTNPKLDLKQPTIFWFIKVISIKFKSIKRFFLLSWPSQNSIKHNFLHHSWKVMDLRTQIWICVKLS